MLYESKKKQTWGCGIFYGLERRYHYGQKPIIYATEKSYELYLDGDYEQYDIWIRNVISKPELSDCRNWCFWQYTNRGKLGGYHGDERYIDMDVFNGSTQEFTQYIQSHGFKNERIKR